MACWGLLSKGLGRYQITKRWQEQDQLHVAELAAYPHSGLQRIPL